MRNKTSPFIYLLVILSILLPGITLAQNSYNAQAAVDYANMWWDGRNQDQYNVYDADCANFVSQCLIAGGLDLSGYGTDSRGCLTTCTNLHSYLTDYPGVTWETRFKGDAEPLWFVPGDPAIFGYSDEHPRTHAVFAVTGDATHYATCNAHSYDQHHKTIQWFCDNSNFDRCTFYHIPQGFSGAASLRVDQQQICYDGYREKFAYSIEYMAPCGQEFTPTLSGLDSVELLVVDFDQNDGLGATLQLNIRNDTITGQVIGASIPVYVPNRPPGHFPREEVVHFDFDATVPLAPGNLYVIEVEHLDGGNFSVCGCGGYEDLYPNGRVISLGSPSQGGVYYYDLWFREGMVEVLSPVVGDLGVVYSIEQCTGTKWCFNQHKTGGHRPGGGICQADDTYAWDINLNYPKGDSDAGKPVYAVAPGVVCQTYGGCINAGGSYGQVLIEHNCRGNTWWSGYLHLKEIRVIPGQGVDSSTVIGYISNTSPDPIPNHLHFIVYRGENTQGGLVSFNTTIVPRPAAITIIAYSPIDLVVTDPDALAISKQFTEIIGAVYSEYDINKDGHLDDEIIIPYRKTGVYLVDVIPESNALPTDTYSLEAVIEGQTMVLAQDVQIEDIPAEPYVFESKLNPSDFDNDGDVELTDLSTFCLHWLEQDCNYPDWCEGTDLNYNHFVDFTDFAIFADNWLWEKIIADINIDGDVDFEDYAVLANRWMDVDCNEPDWCSGADLNKSTFVDFADLSKFTEHWLERNNP